MYGGIIIHLQLHSRMSHKNVLQNGYQCSTIICVINSKKLALCSLPLKCRVIIVWFTGAYVWSAWGKYSLSVTRKSFLPRYTSSHRSAGTMLPCLSTFYTAVIQMMGLDISSMKCSNWEFAIEWWSGGSHIQFIHLSKNNWQYNTETN